MNYRYESFIIMNIIIYRNINFGRQKVVWKGSGYFDKYLLLSITINQVEQVHNVRSENIFLS